MPAEKKTVIPEDAGAQACPGEISTTETHSSANTVRKYQHRALIESSYGEVRALQDPDAYIRYLCNTMVLQRPWLEFNEVYCHLKCVCTRHSMPARPGPGCFNNAQGQPSHQIIADFPMSHRCFLTFNRLLDWLKGCFSKHKNWREAVSKHGEIPFDPELFTRGFFAARTALGHGTTRFTLLGGPKERGWTAAIQDSKLGYLNHDPSTPQGKVHDFWAGFSQHQSANWHLVIKPAAEKAMRAFGKDRKLELKRKREQDFSEGNPPKRPNKKDTVKAQHEFIAAAMKKLIVLEQHRGKVVEDMTEKPAPVLKLQESRQSQILSAINDRNISAHATIENLDTGSSSLEPSISEDVPSTSSGQSHPVFNPSAYMHRPEGRDLNPGSKPASIDMQAAKAAREATKPKISSSAGGPPWDPMSNVYDNISSDENSPSDRNDDEDIGVIKIEGNFIVPQASPASIESPTTPKRGAAFTQACPESKGASNAAMPSPETPTLRRRRHSSVVVTRAQDGEESDSSVTVGFLTPVKNRN